MYINLPLHNTHSNTVTYYVNFAYILALCTKQSRQNAVWHSEYAAIYSKMPFLIR